MALPAPIVRYGKYVLGLGITIFLASTILQSKVSHLDTVSSSHSDHSPSHDEGSLMAIRKDSEVKGSILPGTEKRGSLPLPLPPVPLHEQFNHRFAPLQSVVFTMAFHDRIETFKLFVGSLRWTGFSGHIFIGVVGVTLSEPSRKFLLDNNVRIKEFSVGACAVNFDPEKGSGSNIKCSKEHPRMKAVWAQFLFMLEWLQECTFCRDGVVIADIEVFFQRDPFVANVEPYPIMLFEEHPDARTTHWLVDFTVGKCRDKKFDKPMISAGILMGSRKGMLYFLTRMVNEFHAWGENANCHFPFNGDVQAIVNYLYYTGLLPPLPVVHVAGHREGVANIVGVFGTQVQRDHGSDWEVHKGGREWLPTDILGLIDDNGFFLGKDMAPSAIIYQWESFGDTFKKNWLKPMQDLVFLAPHAKGIERPTALPVGFDSKVPPPTPTPTPLPTVSTAVYENECRGMPHSMGWPDNLVLADHIAQTKAWGHHETSSHMLKAFLWNDGNKNKHRELGNTIDGICMHPGITIVDSPADADVIIWITTMVRVEREVLPVTCKNVIVLDYSDGCVRHPRRKHLQHEIVYFKRSYAARNDGVKSRFCGEAPDAFPLAYSGTYPMVLPFDTPKKYEIVCTLRDGGAFYNVNRGRIIRWLNEYIAAHDVPNTVVNGQVTTGSHNKLAGGKDKYTETINSARIIVTCNPSTWEGDHRLWEAMLTGALVMVDHMDVLPMLPNPPRHGIHYVVYDPKNQSDFNAKLAYYLAHHDEAHAIARAGFDFVQEHHMPQHRIEYILSKMKPPTDDEEAARRLTGYTHLGTTPAPDE